MMADEYEAYTKAILHALRPITEDVMRGDRADIEAWMRSVLSGRVSPRPHRPRSLRRDDDVVVKLFLGLTEIAGTVTSLEMIPKLASHAPPRRAGVEKSAYLQLMVETYLGEIYILKERCDRYRTTIERMYRNDARAASVKQRLDRVGELTADSFKSIVNTRSGHVHQERLDDQELGRLKTLALLSSQGDDAFRWIERDAFRRTKASKVKWMKENNRAVREFLDLYSKAISGVVLTPTSAIRFPQTK